MTENANDVWQSGLDVWQTVNSHSALNRNPRRLYLDLIDGSRRRKIKTSVGMGVRLLGSKEKPVGMLMCGGVPLSVIISVVGSTCTLLNIGHSVVTDLLKWLATVADLPDRSCVLSRFYYTEEQKCLHFYFVYASLQAEGFRYTMTMVYGLNPKGHELLYKRYQETLKKEAENGRADG